ncbi:MAG: Hpt domain-containing protein [Verrucomicrobiota bacterium]
MSESVLNLEYLTNLRDEAFGPEGTEDFKDLLNLYINESIKAIPQISEAVGRSDWEESIRLVHSLKGASRNVGAVDVAALCQETEVSLKAGTYEKIGLDRFLEHVKIKIEATQKELKEKFEL